MTRYGTALELVEEYGLPVFPCKPDKQPATAHGFKDATTSLERIDEWFASGDALIGVPTGGTFWALDIDPAGAGWYREHADRLGCAVVNKTRRGWHLLYRMPDQGDVRCSTGKVAPGVDVRGSGGYVIWWPAEGEQTTGTPADVQNAPDWLLELVQGHPKAPAKPASSTKGRTYTEGGRNDSLTRLAGKLRRDGLSSEELLAALLAANQQRCQPPLPTQEVAQIARSIGRKPTKDDDTPIDYSGIRFRGIDELVASAAPPRTWFFHDLIPAGAFLITGRPKVGKSWLLLQLALAAARGVDFLGYRNGEGGPIEVLYVGAEDDAGRIKERFQIMGGLPPPGLRIVIGEEFHQLAEKYGRVSLADFLDGYLAAHPRTKLVILDTEMTCRAIWDGAGKHRADVKAKDYGETRSMDRVALRHRAFIGLTNHSGKRKSADYLDIHELINRTNTALAGASGQIVLADVPDRSIDDESKRRLLGVRARDLKDDVLLAVEQQADASFASLGKWTDLMATEAEEEILEAAIELREAGKDWLPSKAIAEAIGKSQPAVQKAIGRMMRKSKANRLGAYKGFNVETSRSKGLRLVSAYGEARK